MKNITVVLAATVVAGIIVWTCPLVLGVDYDIYVGRDTAEAKCGRIAKQFPEFKVKWTEAGCFGTNAKGTKTIELRVAHRYLNYDIQSLGEP